MGMQLRRIRRHRHLSSRRLWSPHPVDQLAHRSSMRTGIIRMSDDAESESILGAEAEDVVSNESSRIDTVTRIDADKYYAAIEESKSDNKVVVFKFAASWCKTCRAINPKFKNLAEAFPNVEFYEVFFDDSKKLFKSLGIHALPYIEVYGGRQGKFAGFRSSPKNLPELQTKVEMPLLQYNEPVLLSSSLLSECACINSVCCAS